MMFVEDITDDISSGSVRLKCLMPTHMKQCDVEAMQRTQKAGLARDRLSELRRYLELLTQASSHPLRCYNTS
jgi:hypothetical protein